MSLLCEGIKGEFRNYRTDASKVTPHFEIWGGILLESGPIFGILSIDPKHVLIRTKPILIGSNFCFWKPQFVFRRPKIIFSRPKFCFRWA